MDEFIGDFTMRDYYIMQGTTDLEDDPPNDEEGFEEVEDEEDENEEEDPDNWEEEKDED